jgi:hypothetical protein
MMILQQAFHQVLTIGLHQVRAGTTGIIPLLPGMIGLPPQAPTGMIRFDGCQILEKNSYYKLN